MFSDYILYSALWFFRHRSSINQKRTLVKHKINPASTRGEEETGLWDMKNLNYSTGGTGPIPLPLSSNPHAIVKLSTPLITASKEG